MRPSAGRCVSASEREPGAMQSRSGCEPSGDRVQILVRFTLAGSRPGAQGHENGVFRHLRAWASCKYACFCLKAQPIQAISFQRYG